MKKLLWGIAILLILFSIPLAKYVPKEKTDEVSEKAKAVPSEPPAEKRVPEKRVKLSKGYAFDFIHKKIAAERPRLLECILKNEQFSPGRLELSLVWEGSGKLHGVELHPDPGFMVETCIKNLVKQWYINPHPGLKPFSYRTALVLAGGDREWKSPF